MTIRTIIQSLALLYCVLSPAISTLAEDAAPPQAATESTEAKQDQFFEFEFVCEADVYFSWQPIPPEPEKPIKEANKKKKLPEPIEIVYTRAGTSGHREADVRRALPAVLQATLKQAFEHCVSQHQDQASCISTGINKLRIQYRESDYAIRKTLIDSVMRTCESNRGVCKSTRHGEISCYENRPTKMEPPKAAESEEGGDKKKGKKK